MMSWRCKLIADLHRKRVDDAGGTYGYCGECETPWPCQTFHIAAGWGDGEECWAAHWCEHARVAVF